MKKDILFKIAAVCAALAGVAYVLAGVAFLAPRGEGLSTIVALVAFLAIVALPAITESVGAANRRLAHVMTAITSLAYVLMAVALISGPVRGSALSLTVGSVAISVYFVVVSAQAFRCGAWPRLLALLGVLSGALHGIIPWVLDFPGPLFLVVAVLAFIVQPVWFFWMSLRLWVGGTNVPKPFRRRAAIAGCGALMLLVAVWVFLDRSGARMLEAELTKLRDKGAMTSIDDLLALTGQAGQDLDGRHVVDFFFSLTEDDCVVPEGAVNCGMFGHRLDVRIESLLDSWSPEIEAAVRQICDRNRAFIDRAIEISRFPPAERGTWIDRAKAESLIAFELPALAPLSELTNLLSLQAILACKEGRPDEALSLAGSILSIGNLIGDSEYFLVLDMLAIFVRQTGLTLVQILAQETEFSDQAIRTFGQVLDSSSRTGDFTMAFESERLAGIGAFNALRTTSDAGFFSPMESLVRPYGSRLFRFWLDRDEVAYLRFMNQIVDTSALPVREARSTYEAIRTALRAQAFWRSPLTHLIIPRVSRSRVHRGKYEVRLKLTRIGLALIRFKRDTGAYPETLESLTPVYLAALPADPFSEGPFHYEPEERGFVLYSIGGNFEDDGGEEKGGRDIVWRMAH